MPAPPGPDPLDVDPVRYRMLFENERVRVLEFKDKPGEKPPIHVHPERLIYDVGSWKRKFIHPDGRAEIAEGRAGEVKWSPPLVHSGENIGSRDTHALFVEFKD